MKGTTTKTQKQVDKDTNHMRVVYGTSCLITEAGRADKLLDLAHKRRMNREKFINQPIDAWDI